MTIIKISSTVAFDKNPKNYVNDVDSDISSIIKEINLGIRFPQVTTTERNALTNLYLGKIVYNTTTNKLNLYTGSWEEIQSV